MSFEVDDLVVHLQHGVGRVVKLEMRQFAPGTAQLYYEIDIQKGTIWVPVDGPTDRLRELTPKGELAHYRGLLKSRPTSLAKDHRRRQIELAERLKQGSFQARCEVVRDLTALSWNKPLAESSGILLRNARGVLCEEWAATEGKSLIKAAREVDALLSEGRRTYKK
jgi:RNA polymerase-interacting CarD/CdnL/TRCF family regulator